MPLRSVSPVQTPSGMCIKVTGINGSLPVQASVRVAYAVEHGTRGAGG